MFMERNKWEEEFKETLNQREISPTPHAWDRLDALLNEADAKDQVQGAETGETKPVRSLTWLYVAAGIAAFLLLSTLLVFQGKQEQTNEVVVEQAPKTKSTDEKLVIPAANVNPEKQIQVAETLPVQNLDKAQPRNATTTNIVRREIGPGQNQVAQQEIKKPEPETHFEAPKTDSQKLGSPVSNSSDQQLASIDPKIQDPKNVKVDARSLLSQVDGELDMTFREKTIKSLSRKYKNVKVALANRNNQE
jgi:hypothetical protein